jgi:hypothetical protein
MTEHRIILDLVARAKDGSGHSVFGASGSPMFLACSGSLIPNVMASDEAGFDAAWGTVAHGITELWLKSGRPPDHLLGKKEFVEAGDWGHLINIDDEMFYHAQRCVDVCEWMPGDHLIEEHVDYSHITPIPNQGGTLDFAALNPGIAYLRDHKFGNSPENIVYAEENPQLMLYAIGVVRRYHAKYDFKEFVLGINQPRLDHFDEWTCSMKRLREFEEYARERMAAAWQLDAPRTPGPKQCRWCKVKATCGAYAKVIDDMLSSAFVDETVSAESVATLKNRLEGGYNVIPAPAAELSTLHLSKLLPWRSTIESWLKSVEQELQTRALRGEKVPGHKIVESRTHRKFRDPEKVKRVLLDAGLSRDQIITESMVSPNQAQELLRRKLKLKPSEIEELLAGHIIKPPGGATLVPLSDRRQEMVDAAAVAFTDSTVTPEDEEI